MNHYLDLLRTKPQALNNGRPFVNWELPPVFSTTRQMLMDKHRKKPWEGDKAFIQVLLLLQEYTLEEVTTALELAVEQGSPNVAVVRNFLSRLLDPTPAATVLELPQGIALSREPVADPKVYDLQLSGGQGSMSSREEIQALCATLRMKGFWEGFDETLSAAHRQKWPVERVILTLLGHEQAERGAWREQILLKTRLWFLGLKMAHFEPGLAPATPLPIGVG